MSTIRECPPAGVGERGNDAPAAGPRERPILFSGPMVQAILAGTKTQTRRLVKTPLECTVHDRRPLWDQIVVDPGGTVFGPGPYVKVPYTGGDMGEDVIDSTRQRCPYGYPGEHLWVREAWCDPMGDRVPVYRADGDSAAERVAARTAPSIAREYPKSRWRPSIHMPRWASRITLEITEVRVHRLQEISDADALAEGFEKEPCVPIHPCDWFRDLWDSINGAGSWEANPWVWAISFRRVTP
jgi:hypothetical protein